MNTRRRKVLVGTLMIATVATSVPMTGCEPISAGTATAVVVIGLKQLLRMIAEATVSYMVWRIGDAIYVEISDTVEGRKSQYRLDLQPGEKLEVSEDGKILAQ